MSDKKVNDQIKMTVHGEKAMFLRSHIGEGETSEGEKFNLPAVVGNGEPILHYRGRYASLEGGWDSFIQSGMAAIDKVLEGEKV